MPRELTLQESDGLFNLLHSKNLKSISQARVLAGGLGLRDHPEYIEMVLSGFEDYFSSEKFDVIFKGLFSDGELVITDVETDNKEVVMYFDIIPRSWLNERDGKSLGKDVAKDVISTLKKKIGISAKVFQIGWEMQNDHDHDGFRALPGKEWVVISFSVEFPFRELL